MQLTCAVDAVLNTNSVVIPILNKLFIHWNWNCNREGLYGAVHRLWYETAMFVSFLFGVLSGRFRIQFSFGCLSFGWFSSYSFFFLLDSVHPCWKWTQQSYLNPFFWNREYLMIQLGVSLTFSHVHNRRENNNFFVFANKMMTPPNTYNTRAYIHARDGNEHFN